MAAGAGGRERPFSDPGAPADSCGFPEKAQYAPDRILLGHRGGDGGLGAAVRDADERLRGKLPGENRGAGGKRRLYGGQSDIRRGH